MNTGIFELSGVSIPENAAVFYAPVVDWLRNYVQTPNDATDFVFKIQMISSSSSKIFFDIINKIKQLGDNKDVCVRVLWHYNMYDDEIREQGLEYKQFLEVPFELIVMDDD